MRPRARKPGVYSRVSKAYTWIQDVVCTEWSSSATFCDDGGDTDSDSDEDGVGTSCPDGQMEFDFTVRTDNRGRDIKWVLKNSEKFQKEERLTPGRKVEEQPNISTDTYKLILQDKGGDG
jgi:hypothetical protein